jgi:hypothetical protein
VATKTDIAALQRKAEEGDIAAQIKGMRAVERDDVMDADTIGALKNLLPVGTQRVRASNGADLMVTLYHKYDGRVIEVPSYQAPRYATTRFPSEEPVPREYWRQVVWGLEPSFSEHEDVPGVFQCRVSVKSSDANKAEMKAAGLNLTCRKSVKGGGFQTQFEADEHFRVKHPRRWASYQRFVGRDVQTRGSDAMVQAVQAMQQMAAGLTAPKE